MISSPGPEVDVKTETRPGVHERMTAMFDPSIRP